MFGMLLVSNHKLWLIVRIGSLEQDTCIVCLWIVTQ